jgi:hypothetical protein
MLLIPEPLLIQALLLTPSIKLRRRQQSRIIYTRPSGRSGVGRPGVSRHDPVPYGLSDHTVNERQATERLLAAPRFSGEGSGATIFCDYRVKG